jgi:hypothetical protein
MGKARYMLQRIFFLHSLDSVVNPEKGTEQSRSIHFSRSVVLKYTLYQLSIILQTEHPSNRTS